MYRKFNQSLSFNLIMKNMYLMLYMMESCCQYTLGICVTCNNVGSTSAAERPTNRKSEWGKQPGRVQVDSQRERVAEPNYQPGEVGHIIKTFNIPFSTKLYSRSWVEFERLPAALTEQVQILSPSSLSNWFEVLSSIADKAECFGQKFSSNFTHYSSWVSSLDFLLRTVSIELYSHNSVHGFCYHF